jgi:hypothetical protein
MGSQGGLEFLSSYIATHLNVLPAAQSSGLVVHVLL